MPGLIAAEANGWVFLALAALLKTNGAVPDVQLAACAAITGLCKGHAENRERAAAHGVMALLMRLAATGSHVVQEVGTSDLKYRYKV